jgi:hypothetical protein
VAVRKANLMVREAALMVKALFRCDQDESFASRDGR